MMTPRSRSTDSMRARAGAGVTGPLTAARRVAARPKLACRTRNHDGRIGRSVSRRAESARGVAPRKLKMLSVTLWITRWGMESRVVRGVIVVRASVAGVGDGAAGPTVVVAARGGGAWLDAVRRSGFASRSESIAWT